MNRRLGYYFIISGILCQIIVLGWIGVNYSLDNEARKKSEQILTSINKQISIEGSNSIDYQFNQMPVIEVNGSSYIGKIDIPAIDIKLPILDEWRDKEAKMNPCRYIGSAYDNSLIIAAHNYKSHFGKLSSLKIGDSILLTDVNGKMYNYLVNQIEIINEHNVEHMEAGDWDLTLFTCTWDGRDRFTVRCIESTYQI